MRIIALVLALILGYSPVAFAVGTCQDVVGTDLEDLEASGYEVPTKEGSAWDTVLFCATDLAVRPFKIFTEECPDGQVPCGELIKGNCKFSLKDGWSNWFCAPFAPWVL
ncbi:hypothetical protein AB4254_08770 [Vibrio breoganii]